MEIKKPLVPSDVVVGQYFQFIAIHFAVAIAALYAAGYTVGRFVHSLNDQLAEVFSMGIKDASLLLWLELSSLFMQGAKVASQWLLKEWQTGLQGFVSEFKAAYV